MYYYATFTTYIDVLLTLITLFTLIMQFTLFPTHALLQSCVVYTAHVFTLLRLFTLLRTGAIVHCLHYWSSMHWCPIYNSYIVYRLCHLQYVLLTVLTFVHYLPSVQYILYFLLHCLHYLPCFHSSCSKIFHIPLLLLICAYNRVKSRLLVSKWDSHHRSLPCMVTGLAYEMGNILK